MSFPLALALPNGVRAQFVPGLAASGAPIYEIDGVVTAIDVRIPDDLAANWYWNGSWLAERSGGIQIDTGSFPPPGWPAVRHDCFTSARIIEATSAAIKADFAEAKLRRTKKTKRPVRDVRELLREIPDRIAVVPEPALQMEMEW